MANDELIRKQDAVDIVTFECGKWEGLAKEITKQIKALPPVQMDDAISRQAAIDAVLDRMDIEKHGRNAKPEEIMWTLEKLPPVQPKIIHCKDCKHWNLQVGNVKGDGLGSCDFHNVNLVTGEGFCYWADKRGDSE